MDESELNENGKRLREGVVVAHEMDGELEVFMDSRTTEQLALRLARVADAAREEEQ